MVSTQTKLMKKFEEFKYEDIEIKKFLTKIVKRVYQEEDEDFWGLPYFLEIKNLPKDADEEDIDFENFNWLEISDDKLIICCGGDWQNPLTLTIKLIDNKLTVVDSTEGFSNGLSENEFNTLLFDTYNYEKILKL